MSFPLENDGSTQSDEKTHWKNSCAIYCSVEEEANILLMLLCANLDFNWCQNTIKMNCVGPLFNMPSLFLCFQCPRVERFFLGMHRTNSCMKGYICSKKIVFYGIMYMGFITKCQNDQLSKLHRKVVFFFRFKKSRSTLTNRRRMVRSGLPRTPSFSGVRETSGDTKMSIFG